MSDEKYVPKVGDRVRATRIVEGEVTADPAAGYWFTEVMSEKGRAELFHAHDWTFEKLQDPEPQWVSGDVVRITALCPSNPYATFIRTEGRGWEGVGGNEADQLISNNWRQGTLDILHKADQQDAA